MRESGLLRASEALGLESALQAGPEAIREECAGLAEERLRSLEEKTARLAFGLEVGLELCIAAGVVVLGAAVIPSTGGF